MAKQQKLPATASKRPVGRPTLYDPDFAERAYEYCLLGADNAKLAEMFEIGSTTLERWIATHRDFRGAVKRGRHVADGQVAAALFKRSQGAEWTEEQAIKVKTVEYSEGKRLSETEDVKVVAVRKAAPADPVSMIFWLKNRRRDLWRNDEGAIQATQINITVAAAPGANPAEAYEER